MNNGTLTRKPLLDDGFKDITAPTIKYNDLLGIEAGVHIVASDEVARLDRIAWKYYGSIEKLDALLWVNDIYNPFAIDEKDILYIPTIKDTSSFYKSPEKVIFPDSQEAGTNSLIDSAAKKLNAGMKLTRQESMSMSASEFGGRTTDIRKPNELREGEATKRVDGGSLRLGVNVGRQG